MKKTLKSILAITLALIMSFGTLTAFAATGDTLEWYFGGDEPYVYTSQGELQEGDNTFTCEPGDYSYPYFTLNANKGYYLISFNYPSDIGYIDWVGIPETITDGVAYSILGFISVYENTDNNDTVVLDLICKLDAGETFIGIDAWAYEENAEFTVSAEYLGESITDYDVKNKEYISGYDVSIGETEGWILSDLTVTFSNGTTEEFYDSELYFSCENEIAEGENTFAFEYDGIEKEFTVSVNSIDHYITAAELSNAEDYNEVFVDYNHDVWYYNVLDEVLTVTFNDSTQQDVSIYDGFGVVELPNGNKYPVYVYSDTDYNGNFYLCINIAGTVVKEYECTVTECTVVENGAILIEDVKYEFRDFFGDLYWGLDDALVYNTVAEIFNSLFGTFFDTIIGTANLFSDLFENIVTFIKFYVVG